MTHTHHPQGSDDSDPSGYYDRSHWKEEDEIVNEAVYELS